MPSLTTFITGSLAPGIALTSVIFYNNSLQARFVYIAGRVRELNREARELAPLPDGEARLASLRFQVNLLTRRARLIRRAVVTVYASLLCFIVTIMGLMATSYFTPSEAYAMVPAMTFVLGFLALAAAVLISTIEMSLGSTSILEDIRSSFPEA